jgi:hypothetical protein
MDGGQFVFKTPLVPLRSLNRLRGVRPRVRSVTHRPAIDLTPVGAEFHG